MLLAHAQTFFTLHVHMHARTFLTNFVVVEMAALNMSFKFLKILSGVAKKMIVKSNACSVHMRACFFTLMHMHIWTFMTHFVVVDTGVLNLGFKYQLNPFKDCLEN